MNHYLVSWSTSQSATWRQSDLYVLHTFVRSKSRVGVHGTFQNTNGKIISYIAIVPTCLLDLISAMRVCVSASCHRINTLRPRQDGRHFADDIFTCIFFNENCCILIKFSLKYVRRGPIDNNPALVQIMAWRRSGDKPLSEPIVVSLPTHICVTRPQWVKVTPNECHCVWYHR